MFSIKAIKSFKKSGTVAPSSKFLVRKMLKNIAFDKTKTIVEFGSGNGVFTEGIMDRIGLDSKLYSFELNDSFHQYCADNITPDDRLTLVHDSALEFDKVLAENNITKVDCFVSCLPLAFFNKKDIELLLTKVKSYLSEDGVFLQFQYSPSRYSVIQNQFDSVKIQFTPFNFPPALIYVCK